MAPLGSTRATAAAANAANAAAVQRERSRSRSAEPKVSAASSSSVKFLEPPKLKDWVLFRVSTRFWSKAVPALVSKVTVGIKPEDCTLCLVLPNRFALQFGFGSAKPFLEHSAVPVRDVRPYKGTDHLQLHAALLKAIRDSRTRGRAGPALSAPATPFSPAPATPFAAASLELPFAEAAPVAMTQDDIPMAQPEPVAAAPSQIREEEEDQAGEDSEESGPPAEAAAAAESESEIELTQEVPLEDQLASGPAQEEEAAAAEEAEEEIEELDAEVGVVPPETPRRTSSVRPLALQESEPKGEEVSNMVVEQVAVPVGKKIAPEPVVVAKKAPVVNAAVRFMELTVAVARAFKGAKAEELTRQEIAKAVGNSFGEEELHRGLEQLDKAEKIFLTGDLVFLL